MKSQAEVLQGSGIPTGELLGIEFSQSEHNLLAVAEGIAFNEWSNVCKVIGRTATDTIPDVYDSALAIQGRWSGPYIPVE